MHLTFHPFSPPNLYFLVLFLEDFSVITISGAKTTSGYTFVLLYFIYYEVGSPFYPVCFFPLSGGLC